MKNRIGTLLVCAQTFTKIDLATAIIRDGERAKNKDNFWKKYEYSYFKEYS